jgi:hypothetical protein
VLVAQDGLISSSELGKSRFGALVVLLRQSAADGNGAQDGVGSPDQYGTCASQDGPAGSPIDLAEEGGPRLLHLAQCRAVTTDESHTRRFVLGNIGRQRRSAVHAAEGLQVATFIDDGDRDKSAQLPGSLMRAVNQLVGLAERNWHDSPFW